MPQNCKSPTQRQRFMTTIKDVTEQKERKKKPKSLIGFLSANKINDYNRVGKKEKKKKKRTYRTNQNIRMINVFLESLLSESFPMLEIPLPPQDVLQHCADLWTGCGDCSDSNLALLLCVLASNVDSYQSQCVFFCGNAQWPFIYSIGTESAQLIVWI